MILKTILLFTVLNCLLNTFVVVVVVVVLCWLVIGWYYVPDYS